MSGAAHRHHGTGWHRLIVVAALLAGCATGGDTASTVPVSPTDGSPATPAPAFSTSTSPPTTEPVTTTTPATTTTTHGGMPPPLDGGPKLLVADGMGIRVVEDGSVIAQFLAGRAVTLAVPDRRGGVVFQTSVHEPTGLHWDDTLGRNVLEWANGGPDPIESIAAPLADHQPVDLITHPDARLTLVDVVDIDGRPFVLYRRYMGGPGGHPGDSPWDIVLDYLCLYDLTDGDTEVLGLLGAYESSVNEMRIGGDLVALVHTPYGEGTTRVGVVPLSALFADLEGDWLPTVVMEHLDYGPGDCTGGGGCDTWAVATAARDGSRVVWVDGGRDWDAAGAGTSRRQTLVAVDPATGTEHLRFDLGVESDPDGDPAARPGFIDDDGRTIVVSGVGPDRRVLIVTEGATVGTLGLDGATVSLWDAGAGGPLADEIVLRGDGLGLVDFGAPTDEALSILEAVLGSADRTSDHFFSRRYWDDVGLSVAVDDRPFYRDDGAGTSSHGVCGGRRRAHSGLREVSA